MHSRRNSKQFKNEFVFDSPLRCKLGVRRIHALIMVNAEDVNGGDTDYYDTVVGVAVC